MKTIFENKLTKTNKLTINQSKTRESEHRQKVGINICQCLLSTCPWLLQKSPSWLFSLIDDACQQHLNVSIKNKKIWTSYCQRLELVSVIIYLTTFASKFKNHPPWLFSYIDACQLASSQCFKIFVGIPSLVYLLSIILI